jgi:hypothetical protein
MEDDRWDHYREEEAQFRKRAGREMRIRER